MTDSRQLLADYVENGSETAFRELVTRYVDLVYSAAFRLVNNDAHLAQDVAQTVFADLSRQARTLSREVMLGGWLHRHTCFVARTVMRGERRRQLRERQAAEMNSLEDHAAANLASVAPLLDEAINQLGTEDRKAIVLRFFEQQDFREVGEALGSNDDAARKRVARALDKLQTLLKRRGVVLPVAALGTTLAAEAVAAAPAGLAVAISSSVLSGAAVGSGSVVTFLKIMSMTKLKVAVVGGVVAALAVPLVMEFQNNSRLNTENETLRQKAAQVERLTAENHRLASLAERPVAPAAPTTRSTNDQMELLRLRGEVARLRIAAATAERTNRPSVLSGLKASPEMWNMIREQQKAVLGDLYLGLTNQMNLTPEQREKLNNLMADHIMDGIEQVTTLLHDQKTPEQANQVFADSEVLLQEKVQALLGPDGLAKYQDYTRDLASQVTAMQFMAKLEKQGGDKTALEEKRNQFVTLMQQESRSVLADAGLPADYQLIPSLNFRNFYTEEQGEQSLKLLDSVYERMIADAGAILSPAELEEFKKFRTAAINISRMSLTMNRKMMSPAP